MPLKDSLRRGFYQVMGGGTCAICDTSYPDKTELVECTRCHRVFCKEKIVWGEISYGTGGTKAVHITRQGIPCGILQREYFFASSELHSNFFCAICAELDRSRSFSESYVNVDIRQLYISSSRKQ